MPPNKNDQANLTVMTYGKTTDLENEAQEHGFPSLPLRFDDNLSLSPTCVQNIY
jgi:hypothetical protein